MKSKVEIEEIKNEVLRKIGRNMLLFQKLEQMLKFIVANGKSEGYISEIRANQEKRAATIQKQTMGQLVGQFIEDTHSANDEGTEEQEELKEAYISFNFRIESDAVYYETRKKALATVVADRNELVHHLLPEFNPSSIESCLETGEHLDKQREKLLPEIDQLRNVIETFQKGRKELRDFLMSDEGKKHYRLSFLRQTRLVILLGEIAAQVARPDGWTLLSAAGQLVRQHAPDEIAVLKQRYGHKTLKELILATEIFDLNEEPTNKGGIRVLYRLKQDWALQNT